MCSQVDGYTFMIQKVGGRFLKGKRVNEERIGMKPVALIIFEVKEAAPKRPQVIKIIAMGD